MLQNYRQQIKMIYPSENNYVAPWVYVQFSWVIFQRILPIQVPMTNASTADNFFSFVAGRKFKTFLTNSPWQFQNRIGKMLVRGDNIICPDLPRF